ncbi:MAG: hypothetical protein WEC80_00285 [Patescibacteria group bacterium]
MKYKHSNLCIRCGKERVVKKTWKEKVDNSVIENVLMICPDGSCQKIVEMRIQKQKDKNDEIRERYEERAAQRKVEREKNRKSLKKS